ncbi:probable ubiquitin-conjugating enzyme E2 25 [Sesamum indicum]|uniref:E2 ubiquitin-conjugating enzyme n=1 Tax=Sesamum indicum TaxID=4182 RepID=A0A6I9TDE7_SESIN|nr:probable ubiquitin-conjugating enzyme E2 25 [Sesamum indicum]
MESPTPVSRYIAQNSKKRVFPGGSSSVACKEVEVLELSPLVNRTSKPKSSKQKEVICHEIIDVDMEEDSGSVMLIDGAVDRSGKGKEALSNFAVGSCNSADDGSGSDIHMANYGTVDGFNSNLFYGEDEWIDSYYDDIIYDDYTAMQSHFDHMDIPPGVEVPFPWLPSCPGSNPQVPITSTSTSSSSQIQWNGADCTSTNSRSQNKSNCANCTSTSSSSQIESNGDNVSPNMASTLSSLPLKSFQIKNHPRSRIGTQSATHLKGKWLEPGLGPKKSTTSNGTGFLSSQPSGGSFTRRAVEEVWRSFKKSKRRPRASHFSSSPKSQYPTVPPSPHNQYPSLPSSPTNQYPLVSSSPNSQYPPFPPFPSTVNNYSGHPSVSMQTTPFGGGPYMPVWQDLPMNMLEPYVGPAFMSESPFSPWVQDSTNNLNSAAPARVEQKNVDDILKDFDLFKKFDTVEDYSDHHYSKHGSCGIQVQPPRNWAKKIQEEWKILENNLPDEIFVRVYESRMDLLRAVIVGAEGTPYHDGLFFFDVFFPSTYPNAPPHVYYHSGGLRINPNLYSCGKVCLSLLNTWTGGHKEKWIPGVSTMLQVLVSIQGLILNAKPYFNEPGYADLCGSAAGEERSVEYNEKTFIYSLQTMVYNIRRPPKCFEAFVLGHFCKHARDILVSCKAYMDGAQVGCLGNGGVQDVDEGDKSSSQYFRGSLARFITVLVNTFREIGAKNCEEFLSLSQNANEPATAAPLVPMALQLG